ncbi:biotin-dependent carboxyltransferase family protein [Pelagibacterium halotolerans]|uniref:5-oxoprolinase subunit C family protein n=1 Tax=Pelagibacterium halotolerans TaxID=531813 RepID=UPI00384E4FC6
MTAVVIERAGPLTTIQDMGRPGMLAHGISASGPMDRSGFIRAETETVDKCGAAIECGSMGVAFRVEDGPVHIGFAGGVFSATRNGMPLDWPGAIVAEDGDIIDISAGPAGNYGYIRFDREIGVPLVLGSRATNAAVGLGGFKGRGLVPGDRIALAPLTECSPVPVPASSEGDTGPIRIVWGLHAELFPEPVRQRFLTSRFAVTASMDRMGVRLRDIDAVFAGRHILTLVSDAVVAGDIQILGDGTPVVLMRDHQPTGGYPRIGTIIGADLDRFAQMRPGTSFLFQSITAEHARRTLIERRRG